MTNFYVGGRDGLKCVTQGFTENIYGFIREVKYVF